MGGSGWKMWPCQLGLGIWVARQMPNQVDRCMVVYQVKWRYVVGVERSVNLGLS